MTRETDLKIFTTKLRRGRQLEVATLSWNVVGVVVLAFAAVAARSVALAGFGIDSLIEIGASTVVLWELADVAQSRQRRALRMIGGAFLALAVYLAVPSTFVLVNGNRPHHSPVGIAWTAVTALVMFALAAGKSHIGRALGNPVLTAEARVTMIDGILAVGVLVGRFSTHWLDGGGRPGGGLRHRLLRRSRSTHDAQTLTHQS